MIASSIADLLIVPTLAVGGMLMAPLPLSVVASVFAGAVVFAFALDAVKAAVFRGLNMQ